MPQRHGLGPPHSIVAELPNLPMLCKSFSQCRTENITKPTRLSAHMPKINSKSYRALSVLLRPATFRLGYVLIRIRARLPPAFPLAMPMVMTITLSAPRRPRSSIIPSAVITVTIRRALVTRLINPLRCVVDTTDCTITLLANNPRSRQPKYKKYQIKS